MSIRLSEYHFVHRGTPSASSTGTNRPTYSNSTTVNSEKTYIGATGKTCRYLWRQWIAMRSFTFVSRYLSISVFGLAW